MKRFWDKVEKGEDCWIWVGAKRGQVGYGTFWHNGKMVSAHRLSYTMHHGDIPEGQCVLHRCDTPPCVNPAHLFLGTLADNNRDMIGKGRQVRGSRQGGSKLTEEIVVYIRTSSKPSREIATELGMDYTHINEVRRGKWWKHVPSREELHERKEPKQ